MAQSRARTSTAAFSTSLQVRKRNVILRRAFAYQDRPDPRDFHIAPPIAAAAVRYSDSVEKWIRITVTHIVNMMIPPTSSFPDALWPRNLKVNKQSTPSILKGHLRYVRIATVAFEISNPSTERWISEK